MAEINSQQENEKDIPRQGSIVDIEAAKAEAAPRNVTGLAVVEQGHVIPTTGARKTTTNREYWCYCLWSG